MATDCMMRVGLRFEPKDKLVVAAFDAEHASSDGGAVLFKGVDTPLG
jgi:hypothetical protein